MENEVENQGTADDFPVADFSQWADPEDSKTEPQPGEPATEENGEYPGTWKPILDPLPKEFHAQIAPELKKWDQGVTARFQKARDEAAAKVRDEYKDFERFRTSNIEPQYLENSVHIAQRLETDPVGFLEDLKQMLIADGKYQDAQKVEAVQDNLELDPNDPVVQRVSTMEQQQAQLLKAIETAAQQSEQQQQEFEYQQMRQEAQQTIDQELSALDQKLTSMGQQPLPQRAKLEVLQRTDRLIAAGNPDATVEDGYRDMMKFVQSVSNARPGATAPRIASAGGGSGLPIPQPASLKTLDDRMAAAEAVKAALGN